MQTSSNAVLVLDVDFQPLRIEHWRQIISDYFNGKVEIIHNSEDRTIKTVSQNFPMPSVVRVLRRFKRDRQVIKFSRINIYARDAFTCQFCGIRFPSEKLNFDHVIPRSRGGKTNWLNIVTSCFKCNTIKANQTPEEAGMTLLRIPKKPTRLPTVTVEMSEHVPEEWKYYWTSSLQQR